MKKFIFVCMLIMVMSTTVFATDVNVKINDEKINFTDSAGQTVNAQIINSRTMVPMRKIFEILGANVAWDGENRIVTADKEEVSIKLQIDNLIATKTINGVSEDITLDTPPMIVNDRTMVPLRFIAESLDKQVGWDAVNKTAVIIDYEYFVKRLEEKMPGIYTFIENHDIPNEDGDYSYYNVKVSNKYYDLMNSNNNDEITLNARVTVDDELQKVTFGITGTNELSEEITSEGWNNTLFNLTYGDEKVVLTTDNIKLKEMFKISNKPFSMTYEELRLEGNESLSMEKMFQVWAGIKEENLTVETFNNLKKDFDMLCNLFTKNGNIYEASIRYSNYNVEYFDLAKLDNFIFDNEYSKIINVINGLFFKNDVLSDEVLYDNSNVNMTLETKNNEKELNVTIETKNDYSEENEYTINLQRIK